jgi:hypothetical protein
MFQAWKKIQWPQSNETVQFRVHVRRDGERLLEMRADHQSKTHIHNRSAESKCEPGGVQFAKIPFPLV